MNKPQRHLCRNRLLLPGRGLKAVFDSDLDLVSGQTTCNPRKILVGYCIGFSRMLPAENRQTNRHIGTNLNVCFGDAAPLLRVFWAVNFGSASEKNTARGGSFRLFLSDSVRLRINVRPASPPFVGFAQIVKLSRKRPCAPSTRKAT